MVESLVRVALIIFRMSHILNIKDISRQTNLERMWRIVSLDWKPIDILTE